MRHGKSSWDDAELSDFDRGLNSRGKRDVPQMANRLLLRDFSPQQVLCSSSRRTRKTWKLLAEHCKWDSFDVEFADELYLASVQSIVQKIASCADKVSKLMLIGHNPGLTDFLNLYSEAQLDNLPTSGMCALTYPIQSWEELNQLKGKVVWFDYPKLR